MNRSSILTQKVNFFVSVGFIATFGFFCTWKIIDVITADNPITAAVAQTAEALAQK